MIKPIEQIPCLHVLHKGWAITVTVRLTVEQKTRLDALVYRTGRTKSFFFRQAIQSHLEDLGDAYATDEALKVFEESDTAARPVTVLWAELGLGEPKIAEGRATNGANRV